MHIDTASACCKAVHALSKPSLLQQNLPSTVTAKAAFIVFWADAKLSNDIGSLQKMKLATFAQFRERQLIHPDNYLNR
jgi:hypothetical protein